MKTETTSTLPEPPSSLPGQSNLLVRSGIITSFSITAEPRDLSRIPSDCNHIEVYAFMRNHLRRLFPEYSGNAVTVMATLFREGRSLDVATQINQEFPNKKVVGFATFIPELTAGRVDARDTEDAGDALKLLIQAARFLHRDFQHPIQTIELVGGSRIEYVYQRPVRRGSGIIKPEYAAQRLDEGSALQQLLGRLEPVAKFAASEKEPIYLEPVPKVAYF